MLARQSQGRYNTPSRVRRMGERGYRLYKGRWAYDFALGDVMAQESVPFSLAAFASAWLQRLGLDGKKCLLARDDSNLPSPFSGSMKLYRDDGTHLELDTVAKPLEPDCPYVRAVRAGDFDIIVISVAGWSLEDDPERPCPACGCGVHTALQHTVLHELVHVAYPEYSADNEWTDNKVRELLELDAQDSQ